MNGPVCQFPYSMMLVVSAAIAWPIAIYFLLDKAFTWRERRRERRVLPPFDFAQGRRRREGTRRKFHHGEHRGHGGTW